MVVHALCQRFAPVHQDGQEVIVNQVSTYEIIIHAILH